MRRLLLDSHIFLWWLADSRKLNDDARDAIAEASAMVHVSAVTIWEIAIKARLGKVHVRTKDLAGEIAANHFLELQISARHALAAGYLPSHHRDRFDRMLIAQARLEELRLITHDRRC